MQTEVLGKKNVMQNVTPNPAFSGHPLECLVRRFFTYGQPGLLESAHIDRLVCVGTIMVVNDRNLAEFDSLPLLSIKKVIYGN